MAFKPVGVLSGRRLSFLDHLAPLCSLFDAPLYSSDRWVGSQVEIFYPDIVLTNSLGGANTFLYVEPSRTPHGSFCFGDFVHPGKVRSICALHGNSDKNRDSFWIERLADEEHLLLYGPFIRKLLEEKGVFSRLHAVTFVGNYRKAYYEKHKDFFDQLIAPHLFPPSERKTILYAPTWCGGKTPWNSPFFEYAQGLFEKIPDDFQLYVKLHPFYFYLYPKEVEKLRNIFSEKENIRFLGEIPLIYPLLEKVDIYLGDYSSVGYDFLSYDRPLFFLTKRDDQLLQSCGQKIEQIEDLYFILREDSGEQFRKKRGEIYNDVFGPSDSFDAIKKRLEIVK